MGEIEPKEQFDFYAYIGRMKYILRWGLMRNTDSENIQEHSLQVAILAHALAVIHNQLCGREELSPDRACVYAVFHDAGEIITGDLPTPVKYYNPLRIIRRSKPSQGKSCCRCCRKTWKGYIARFCFTSRKTRSIILS